MSIQKTMHTGGASGADALFAPFAHQSGFELIFTGMSV
jgi:hypothetical protein